MEDCNCNNRLFRFSGEGGGVAHKLSLPPRGKILLVSICRYYELRHRKEVYLEDRSKQTEAFARMLELLKVPLEDRPQVMHGVDLFFDRGWPSNHFTVGMAARAGAGLLPPTYEGPRSEAKYKALMDAEDAKKAKSK